MTTNEMEAWCDDCRRWGSHSGECPALFVPVWALKQPRQASSGAPAGEAGAQEVARAISDIRWYALRLCRDNPERYEVKQTRHGVETTLADACVTVLTHIDALESPPPAPRPLVGDLLTAAWSAIEALVAGMSERCAAAEEAAGSAQQERDELVVAAQALVDSGASGGHYLGVSSAKFHALEELLAARSPSRATPVVPGEGAE